MLSERDDEQDTWLAPSNGPSSSEGEQSHKEAKGDDKPCTGIKGGVIATLSRILGNYTFRIKGGNTGTMSHSLGQWWGNSQLHWCNLGGKEKFLHGRICFNVVVANGYNMTCTQSVPCLNLTLGNYTFTNDLYILDLTNTNVVLGLKRLYSLGKFLMNY